MKKNRSRDMQISKLENKFVMELISAPKKLVVLFGVIKKHYPLVVPTLSEITEILCFADLYFYFLCVIEIK